MIPSHSFSTSVSLRTEMPKQTLVVKKERNNKKENACKKQKNGETLVKAKKKQQQQEPTTKGLRTWKTAMYGYTDIEICTRRN